MGGEGGIVAGGPAAPAAGPVMKASESGLSEGSLRDGSPGRPGQWTDILRTGPYPRAGQGGLGTRVSRTLPLSRTSRSFH